MKTARLIALARLKLTHCSSPILRALANDGALAKLKRNSRKSRKARKAYDDARVAKLDSIPDAKQALTDTEAAEIEIGWVRKALRDTENKVRQALDPRKDKQLKAALDKFNAARRQVGRVTRNETINKLAAARTAARKALEEKRKPLISKDKGIQHLQRQLEQFDQQLRARRKVAGSEDKIDRTTLEVERITVKI